MMAEETVEMKHVRKRRRWLWVGIVLLLVATSACRVRQRLAAGGAALDESSGNELATAFVGDLASTASAAGEVRPIREADLVMATSGKVQAVLVTVADVVQAGDVLVQMETGDLERAVRVAEQSLAMQEASLEQIQTGATAADLSAAQAAMDSAQVALDAILAGANEAQIAAMDAQLRAAEASLTAAEEQYEQLLSGATEADLLQAQKAVEDAREQQKAAADAHIQTLLCREVTLPTGETREFCVDDEIRQLAELNAVAANENLAAAEARYATLRAGASAGSLESALASIDTAKASRDSAQANLEATLQPAAADQVASARAQLAQASATLQRLKDGALPEQITIAEVGVAQARIALERARVDLGRATLIAPFDGVVTAVNVAPGEMASGVAISLADATTLEVVLSIDEIDLATIDLGQSAVVRFDSFPGEEVSGTVSTIGLRNRFAPGSDLVAYDVSLFLEENELPLLSGMTADASLVTAERDNVLLLPNRAIRVDRISGTYSVTRVVNEDLFEEITVTIGLRDSQYSEITGGLAEGDVVLIDNDVPLFRFEGGPGL